jgi:hypothetical protein
VLASCSVAIYDSWTRIYPQFIFNFATFELNPGYKCRVRVLIGSRASHSRQTSSYKPSKIIISHFQTSKFRLAMTLDLLASGHVPNPLGVSALILLLHLVIGFGLAFVPPAHRCRRAALMVISVSIAVNVQISKTQLSKNGYLNGFLVTTVWCNIVRAIDLSLLKKVYISPEINVSNVMDFYRPRSEAKSWGSRFLSATLLPCTSRYVGTPWACNKIPPFSTTDPFYTPSRRNFLLKSSIVFVLTYAFIDPPNSFPPPSVEEIFPVAKEAIFARLSEITPDELGTRTLLVL